MTVIGCGSLAAAPNRTAKVISSATPAITRPCVLLVEDNCAVRRSLQMLLQGQGYDVRSHATGASLVADPRVDDAVCVITDYQMVGLDGLAVLARLRSGGWHGPAILVTAFGTAEVQRRAAAAGFAAVIAKPFGGQALLATIKRLVGATATAAT